MELLTHKSPKRKFFIESIFIVFVALVTVFACDFEDPIPTYTLTTSVSPNEGGKITRSPELPNYKAGEVVTLTPEPNEHWVFKQWDGDATGNTTPLQISMNSNKSVTGVFVKRDYPLNIKIEGQGTVEEKIIPNPSGREYPHGTRVELKPIPKEGWVFESWGGDLSGNETPQIITVDKEKNVIVKFKRRDYPLNITITGEGTVEEKIVSVPGGKTYPFETVVELKPVPKLGWVFESWGGDLTGNEATKNIAVDKEKNVTVKFKRKDYPLNVTISGEGTVEEKIVSSPGGRSYPYQTVVELAPKPKEGWVFEEWAGDLTGNETPKNITVDKEKNVTAKFKRRDYPLNLTIEGEGLIEEKIVSSPGNKTYPFQTVVELTPKPKDGWIFESWGGDLTGNEVPKTITVDKEKNVTAKFKEIFYTANFIPILNLPTGVVFVSHSIHYEYNGKEYILGGGVNWNDPSHYRPPLVQLVRTNDNWEVINVFNEVEMSEIRNSEFSKDGKYIIISDHGPEWPDIQWPFSHVYIGEIKENDIIWNKVSKNPSFYHDASFGDLNGDGIVDAVGGHLGTRNGNNDNPHVYLGLAGNKFEELKNILPIAPEGGCCGDVEIYDLNKNGINEIIRIGGSWQKENMDGVEYNRNTNKFEIVFSIEGSIPDNYVTSLYSNIKKENYINNFRGYMPSDNRFKDFNGDGNIDFINEKDGLTIWYGDGKMNFSPMRLNIQATDQSGLGIWDKYYPMSGQRYFDIENDGDLDIVTKHFTLGNPNLNTGIKLYNMIYINDNGVFKRLSDQRYFVKNEDVKSSYPGSMFIPFLRKGKLCFIGYTFDNKGSGPFEVMLEIETNIPASYWYGN